MNASPGLRRTGRKPVSLSDLFVLVLGVALTLWLQWHTTWLTKPNPSVPTQPLWVADGRFVEELLEKTSLALIPLMLWRRVRLGGSCRSAELLLVVCGTVPLVDDIDWALWGYEAMEGIDYAGDLGSLFWRCHAAAWILCVAAIMTLMLRKGLDDRTRTVVLTLAVATSFAWLLMPMQNLYLRLSAWLALPQEGETMLAVAARTVAFLIPGILGALAVRDAAGRPNTLGMLGWVALLLASCDIVVATPVCLWGRYMPAIPPLRDIHLHAEYFGGPIVAGILGGLVAPLVGPHWDRWFGSGNKIRDIQHH